MPMILDGTNGAFLPTWTTATRPASPANGEIGYNSTTAQLDQYVGGAWSSVPTGTTAPGGSTTQVQYNNAGAFAGSANLTFSGSALALTGSSTILKNGGTGATAGLLLSGGGTSTNFNIDYGTVASNRLYFRQNYFDGSGNITFQYSSDGTMASPIDVLAIKYGGGIAVTGLTDISAATSGQIKFPATQNASSNANTLDDYEEGTYTPSIQNFTVSGTTTLTGSYTRIGNLVSFNVTFTNTGTIAHSASALISTPFNSGLQNSGAINMWINTNGYAFNSNQSGTQLNTGETNFDRFFVGSFTTTSAGQQLLFAGTYRITP